MEDELEFVGINLAEFTDRECGFDNSIVVLVFTDVDEVLDILEGVVRELAAVVFNDLHQISEAVVI